MFTYRQPEEETGTKASGGVEAPSQVKAEVPTEAPTEAPAEEPPPEAESSA